MKKTLIALAVLGSIAGVAQAQSSVTIYGKVDVGVAKLNGDTEVVGLSSATQLQGNHTSRIGVKGSEDLGGGLSAIFQLESRFDASEGTLATAGEALSGPAYVGLAGTFGQVRLGRNYGTMDSVSSSAIDPFEGDGIGGMVTLTPARINNTITYYTPEMSGFGAQAQYILGEETGPAALQNNGYAVAATYNNGPIYFGAGYGVEENSNKSNIWALSGSYAFGPAKIALGYDQATVKDPIVADFKVKNAVVAATYEIGAGLVKAAYGQTRVEDVRDHKLSIGYQHNLSKRTSVYADVARTRFDLGTTDADVNGVNVGVTHNF